MRVSCGFSVVRLSCNACGEAAMTLNISTGVRGCLYGSHFPCCCHRTWPEFQPRNICLH